MVRDRYYKIKIYKLNKYYQYIYFCVFLLSDSLWIQIDVFKYQLGIWGELSVGCLQVKPPK